MIKLSYEEIVAKIKENSKLSDSEIQLKIRQKMDQLSGLISKEGAAHIIANELGIKVIEATGGKLQIKNILSGMRNVDTVGKALQVYELRTFEGKNGPGKLASMMIGDETGTIRVVGWGSKADVVANIMQGDIVKLRSGYVRDNNGRKEVHLNDNSDVVINPPGETVDAVAQPEQAQATRKAIKDLTPEDTNAELLGTIVQVFDPRFFEVCPQCNKRAKPGTEGFSCDEHGLVTPAYSYVMNVMLDDGTENIRLVFFKSQMQRLLNLTDEQLIAYKDTPANFETIKSDLLGKIVKVVGRASKNDLFDRMEFVSQLVFPDPDPEEEIKRIKNEESV